jgi:hypothetical protein
MALTWVKGMGCRAPNGETGAGSKAPGEAIMAPKMNTSGDCYTAAWIFLLSMVWTLLL